MDYTIVYEDNDLLLVDKPQGLPTSIGKHYSLCELVFKDYPELSLVKGYNEQEGGLLNRLDNDTGGIVFFAKNTEAFNRYLSLMRNNQIIKFYTALVENIPQQSNGIIDYPIAHHIKKKNFMVICEKSKFYRGKPQTAITKWTKIEEFENKALLKIEITKGVRHQIRLHLATKGFPIIGDKLYNKKSTIKTKYHLLYATGVFFYSFERQKKIMINITANFSDYKLHS